MVAIVGGCAAVVGVAVRPRLDQMPEATLFEYVDSVEDTMAFSDVVTSMRCNPDSNWMDESASGYAVWRFEVSDVPYAERRASFFVKFKEGVVESSFLLYPVESAGGGMVF